MKLTKLEGELFIRVLELIRQQCLQLEGNLEETSSILIGVEDRGAEWAAAFHVEMGMLRQNVAVIEEKARRIWIPKIKEKCQSHENEN